MLDLVGVSPPNPPAGRSLRALLEDPDAEWEDLAFAELSGTPESGELRWMMRAGRYKYMWHGEGEAALFDVVSDPGELVNLVGLPEHADLIAGLRERFEALGDETTWSVTRGRR